MWKIILPKTFLPKLFALEIRHSNCLGQKKAAYKEHSQELMTPYTDSDLRAIYRQGEKATVAFMKTLLERLSVVERRLEELSRRSGTTSRTSSKPTVERWVCKTNNLARIIEEASRG
ncbi:MAG: hypothetical protein MUF71_04985 [Candidatus Kapabacteria bacterium]|nr:hypothetical protein [Candidatus Kapabacteria bacterium]